MGLGFDSGLDHFLNVFPFFPLPPELELFLFDQIWGVFQVAGLVIGRASCRERG